MIEGKKNILDWFEATGFGYWNLYDLNKTDSGNWKAKSDESEGATSATALAELHKSLSRIANGKFTLVAMSKPGSLAKGKYVTDISISYMDQVGGSPLPAATPVLGGIPEGYIKESDVSTKIQDALAKYQAEQEVKQMRAELIELRKENKELEKAANGPWERVIGSLEPYLPMLLGHAMPQLAGLPVVQPSTQTITSNATMPQTTDNNEELTLTDAENERLSNVISVLYHAAPTEWLDLLERIAGKVQTNPAIINTVKAFL